MATVEAHYDNVLASVYTWMAGGFESGSNRSRAFFEQYNIKPTGSKVALDLGAGSGFQSIPLAELGFVVTAVDLSKTLLAELHKHADGLPIKIVQDDLINFPTHCQPNIELIVCMTDTLTHLESQEKVTDLLNKAFNSLETGGKLIFTFRDLTFELKDLDRFIPLKSDETTIFTVFLEYEPDFVKVHDIVHRKNRDGTWEMAKSYYRKLRVSKSWMEQQLTRQGFTLAESTVDKGVVTMIASKQ